MEAKGPIQDCPKCGDTMQLARVTPRLGPHPDLLTFRCDACGEVVTTVGDDDPGQDLD